MPRFYNNIFAFFFKNLNSNDPRDASTYLMAAIHFLHIGVLFALIANTTHFSILSMLGSKYYVLIFGIPWMYFLSRYYNEDRRHVLLERFEKKPRKTQLLWAIIAVTSLLLPIPILSILLAKP